MLKRILQAMEPSPLTADREALRAAHTVRDRAEEVHRKASAKVERFQAIITAAEAAQAEAAQAQAEVQRLAREWAASGALDDAPAGHREAMTLATAAQRRAEEAQSLAIGAKHALPALQEEADDARVALNDAKREAQRAEDRVLVATVEQRILALDPDRERYAKKLSAVYALVAATEGCIGSNELGSRLREFTVVRLQGGGEGSSAFAEFRRRLATDADAVFHDD